MIKYAAKTRIIILLLIFCSTLRIQSQELYFPEKGSWTESKPETYKINSSLLDETIQFANEHECSGQEICLKRF